MRKKLDQALDQAFDKEVRNESSGSSESAASPVETESPTAEPEQPVTGESEAVAAKVAEAFPGSVDVSPADPLLIEVVVDYLGRLTGDQASVRAWNKYAKEKGYPKDKMAWTTEQATEAANFLESL